MVPMALREIRELADDDLPAAFEVVRQLRGHLDLEEFSKRTAKQMLAGFRMYGGFDEGGVLVGVVGFRPVCTLARGEHLHIDDLVVDEAARGRGVGRSLLAFAEGWAAENGLGMVFLDSRRDALGFYSALGFEPHTATLVKKRIDRL